LSLSSKEIVEIALKAIEDIKGQGVRCINVDKLTSITDYMVMATGTSNTHVKSLADAVVKEVKEAGLQIVGVEGKLGSDWVLVDLGDVVVHLMTASTRALYNLEDLWSFNKNAVAPSEFSAKE
jgi:ribosome-associated protein